MGCLWLAGIVVLAVGGLIPVWLAAVYGTTSAAAFLTYAVDKARAGADRRRVPERVLHLLALAGGWPGALVAQEWYRHKTRKVLFQIIFWIIVATHAGAVASLLYIESR